MNIKFNFIENVLSVTNEHITTYEIENKNYFYRCIKELYLISHGGKSEVLYFFDNDNKEINLTNKFEIIFNYFSFDFDSKKLQGCLKKVILDEVTEDDKQFFLKAYNQNLRKLKGILNKLDLDLEVSDNFEVETILKQFDIKIKLKESLLENLFLLIDVEKVFHLNVILIFVNLKQFLSKAELEELYKYALYNKIKIVLVDSSFTGITSKYEKKLCIDNELTEFML